MTKNLNQMGKVRSFACGYHPDSDEKKKRQGITLNKGDLTCSSTIKCIDNYQCCSFNIS